MIPLSGPRGLPTSCPSGPVLPPSAPAFLAALVGLHLWSSSLPQPLDFASAKRFSQVWLPCTGGVHTSEPEASSRQLISSQDRGTDLDLSFFSGLLRSLLEGAGVPLTGKHPWVQGFFPSPDRFRAKLARVRGRQAPLSTVEASKLSLRQLSEQLRGLSQLCLCGRLEAPSQLVWKDSLLASFLGVSGSITTSDLWRSEGAPKPRSRRYSLP